MVIGNTRLGARHEHHVQHHGVHVVQVGELLLGNRTMVTCCRECCVVGLGGTGLTGRSYVTSALPGRTTRTSAERDRGWFADHQISRDEAPFRFQVRQKLRVLVIRSDVHGREGYAQIEDRGVFVCIPVTQQRVERPAAFGVELVRRFFLFFLAEMGKTKVVNVFRNVYEGLV